MEDHSKNLALSFLEHAFEAMYTVDLERRVEKWNPAAERLTGFAMQQIAGNRCSDGFLLHVDESGARLCGERCPLQATLEDGCVREANVFLRHKLGHRIPVCVRTFAIRNPEGAIVGAAELFRGQSNCDELSQRAEELERLAYRDKLTELPNRRFAEDRLSLLIERFRQTGLSFGAALVDLDHFKQVNDRYGHEAGDALLKAVSLSFAHGLRASDLVARWGGDEFILFSTATEEAKLRGLSDRCRVLVECTQARFGQTVLEATASVGSDTFLSSDNRQSFLERIDRLVYESKRAGRNRVTMIKDLALLPNQP